MGVFMRSVSVLLLAPLIVHAQCPQWSIEQAKNKLEQLNQEIHHHSELYFQKQSPILSDHEFDALALRLQSLSACFPDISLLPEAQQLPEQMAGQTHIKHQATMGSLKKAESDSDITQFLNTILSKASSKGVMLQPKIDGIAIELVYRNGQLIAASTRGNGASGKNILNKIKAIPNIPNTVSITVSDVVLHGELFARLDLWMPTLNKGRYSSARHFAAGVMNSKNPTLDDLETLDFFPWRWVNSPAHSESSMTNQLYALGFNLPTQYTRPVNDLADIIKHRDALEKQAKSLPFLLDGIVLKANNLKTRHSIGWSGDKPNWAIAWKFPPDAALTTITDIKFTVGRTGNITPIVVFKPVTIKGETIEKVSLGSIQNLHKKDIAPGDQISIVLKGSATPVFSQVMIRSKQRVLPDFPKPDRYTPYTCMKPSADCEEQFTARLHWLGKRLDLPGLDKPNIKKLIKGKHIQSLADILTLSPIQLQQVGMNKEKAGYISAAIQLVGSVPFHQQIRALSIPNLGVSRSKQLAKTFVDWNTLLKATDRQLKEASSIEDGIIKGFRDYVALPEIKALIEGLNRLKG